MSEKWTAPGKKLCRIENLPEYGAGSVCVTLCPHYVPGYVSCPSLDIEKTTNNLLFCYLDGRDG